MSEAIIREWIESRELTTIEDPVYDSPTNRQSVLEPRESSEEAPPAPRFSFFTQHPLVMSIGRFNSKTVVSSVTIDEQYHEQGVVVPDTTNPAQSSRPNSLRIHLPETRDTEVFSFKMF